jgi:hypothetical protein
MSLNYPFWRTKSFQRYLLVLIIYMFPFIFPFVSISSSKTIHAQSHGADEKFVQKVTEFHGSHEHYSAGSKHFTIKHYAGEFRNVL